MEYTSLYRKFRPITFHEMVGQEHITRTLRNQIISGRIGHAYLFNGGRGTGKTSSAKIFARAINCLSSKDGEPCNECEICKAMLNGSLTDVVEMDAASNNGVDDIRVIREEVNFLPTVAKYRVYIIDEVHMLSTGAFNALLKTLEEPPEHVKFILATTEPQKLPATILSRCQRFDFKKIPNEDIVKRLKIICDEIQVQISNEALNLIAVLSEGAMRDGISILERCIQEGEKEISEGAIKELVGIPPLTQINELAKNICEYQIENAIVTIDNILKDGKDTNNILWELIKYVKDILIYKTTQKLEIYSEQELESVKELCEKFEKERLTKLIFDLSELENKMKWSTQKDIVFETGIITLCIERNESNLEKRIKSIEEKIQNGNFNLKSKEIKKEEKIIKKEISKEVKEKIVVNTNGAVSYWNKIIEELKKNGKMMIYTNLINTIAKETPDNTLEVFFQNGITSFGKTVLNKPENIEEITNLVLKETGKKMRIIYIDKPEEKKQNDINGLDELGIPVNIID